MVQLVRQALRMRPDRLVVGEVRGAEVRDLLLAPNTGHEGGCGTLHANRAEDVPSRLEALGALAGMGRDAVRAQVASALEVVVHLRRVGGLQVPARAHHHLHAGPPGQVAEPAGVPDVAPGAAPRPGQGRSAPAGGAR